MKNQIKCPNCNETIDVQDVLAHQLEEEYNIKLKTEIDKRQSKFDEEYKLIEGSKKELIEKQKMIDDEVNKKLDQRLATARKDIELRVKTELSKEQADQFDEIQKELNEKSEKLKEFNRAKAEIEKLKREKNEIQEEVEAAAQKRLNEQLTTEKSKIRKAVEEQSELKFLELQKQLDDQKKLTEEMKRKQEQGSMQLQGEVQELAIEEWLQNEFPLDTIAEIKKGARGADCLQIVNTRENQDCGTIYYESKRTKEFQISWIEKFKKDMKEKNADIGVIVTEAMPNDLKRMGIKDGVWICDYNEFKGLCSVLRESIIRLNMVVNSQENKGDKMHLLYDYLTSNSFRMQVEAIVEGFSSMKTALDKERNSMNRIWKEREKQIDKVLINTIEMYGSVKGIAGNSIQTVSALELTGEV